MRKIDDGNTLMDTFKWFIYEEYGKTREDWTLPSCPKCDSRDLS